MRSLLPRVRDAARDLRRAFAALAARLAEPAPTIVRIGLHGSAISLRLLKQQAGLELRFPATRVEWLESAEEAPLIEALSAGRLELGCTGCAAPLFAQAEGRRVHYVGAELAGPCRRLAVRVRPDSPCTSLADLEGGRLALQRGGDAHCLLARALAEVGLEWKDVEPVWLAPRDAWGALERGTVDAACSCDTEGELDPDRCATRDLASALGLSAQDSVYLASPAFATRHPQALLTLLGEVKTAEDGWHSNTRQAGRLRVDAHGALPQLQGHLALPPHASMAPLTAAWVAGQQRLADDMAQLRLVDAPVTVMDRVWRPPS